MAEITLKLVLSTAPLLLKSGKYEETSFALTLLKKFSSQFTKQTFAELEKWFQYGIINWAHSDSISLDVFPLFLTNKIVPLKSFASWRKSSNKYQRRCAAVTLIKLLKTTDNFQPFFKFLEPLMTDPAREVHQGVGWFLREAWKIHRTETEAFLLKWKDTSPRLIFQYATEKMTPKEKLRFKKSPVGRILNPATGRRKTRHLPPNKKAAFRPLSNRITSAIAPILSILAQSPAAESPMFPPLSRTAWHRARFVPPGTCPNSTPRHRVLG